MIFVLEDDGSRVAAFRAAFGDVPVVYSQSAMEAVAYLQQHAPRLVFLDRDLGGNAAEVEVTGEDVVNWLHRCQDCRERFAETIFVVHSLNDPGAKRMVARLQAAGFQAVRRPNVWMDLTAIRELVTSARPPCPVPPPG